MICKVLREIKTVLPAYYWKKKIICERNLGTDGYLLGRYDIWRDWHSKIRSHLKNQDKLSEESYCSSTLQGRNRLNIFFGWFRSYHVKIDYHTNLKSLKIDVFIKIWLFWTLALLLRSPVIRIDAKINDQSSSYMVFISCFISRLSPVPRPSLPVSLYFTASLGIGLTEST